MRWIVSVLVAALSAQAVSSYALAPRASYALAPRYSAPTRRATRGQVSMGKMAKFGLFSPAVLAVKNLLGEKTLNKLRGQGITLHSQAITEFCVYVGASSKLRGGLIKKAKTTGDELGFLY